MSFSTLNTFNSINKNNKLPLLQSDTTTLYTNYIPTLTQNGDNNITNLVNMADNLIIVLLAPFQMLKDIGRDK